MEYTIIQNLIYYDHYKNVSPFIGTFKNCVFQYNSDFGGGGYYPYIFEDANFIQTLFGRRIS